MAILMINCLAITSYAGTFNTTYYNDGTKEGPQLTFSLRDVELSDNTVSVIMDLTTPYPEETATFNVSWSIYLNETLMGSNDVKHDFLGGYRTRSDSNVVVLQGPELTGTSVSNYSTGFYLNCAKNSFSNGSESVTATFQIKETITLPAEFDKTASTNMIYFKPIEQTASGTTYSFVTRPGSRYTVPDGTVLDSISIPAVVPNGYSVSLTGSGDITTSDTEIVYLDVTNSDVYVTNYSSISATINYDATSFEYVENSITGPNATTGKYTANAENGTLKVTYNGPDVDFTTNSEQHEIAVSFKPLKAADSAAFTLAAATADPAENATGDATAANLGNKTATVNVTGPTVSGTSDYGGGYILLQVTYSGTGVPTYNGNAMFTRTDGSYTSGTYYYVVADTPDSSKLGTSATLTTEAITYTAAGDANGTGKTDINDAQFVWNIYNNLYTRAENPLSSPTVRQLLMADVDGNLAVNTTDAAAVITALFGG